MNSLGFQSTDVVERVELTLLLLQLEVEWWWWWCWQEHISRPGIDRRTAQLWDATDGRPVRSCTANWRLRIRHRGPSRADRWSIACRPPVSARSIFQSVSCETSCTLRCVFFDRWRFVILCMCPCLHASLLASRKRNPFTCMRFRHPSFLFFHQSTEVQIHEKYNVKILNYILCISLRRILTILSHTLKPDLELAIFHHKYYKKLNINNHF